MLNRVGGNRPTVSCPLFSATATQPMQPSRAKSNPAAAVRSSPSNRTLPLPSAGASERVGQLMGELEQRRTSIDEAIAQASRGRSFSPAELIALQAQVYAYSQEVEVVSRFVDKIVGAVKTTLNMQV